MVKKEINCCACCHHAIVHGVPYGWVHFSADDWAGAFSECPCASSLVKCRPPDKKKRGLSFSYAVYDEVAAFTEALVAGGVLPGRERAP